MLSDWKENKKSHNSYWGGLYNHLQTSNINNVRDEFISLNNFEMKGKAPIYLSNGKAFQVTPTEYTLNKQNLFHSLLSPFIEGADYLLDLGSGWGRNSIGYHIKNPNQKIICGELSDSGRDITNYFTKKYNLPIETFEFNWYDFTTLIELLKKKKPKSILLFSNHTIEQVDYLEEGEFRKLFALPIKIKGVQFEPLGWQYNNKPFPFQNHYNRNYKEILDSLEKDSILKVNDVNHTLFNFSNTPVGKNSTYIQWEKL